ncbi:MAG: hypothetical protein JWP97_3515, partial [Labilithrix sp.]|nr:hypothetical protein [Labilithrix sp.]
SKPRGAAAPADMDFAPSAPAPPPPRPAAKTAMAPGAPRALAGDDAVLGGAAAETSTASKGSAGDSSFATAKALYDDGRYADALTTFDALKGSSPDAALYAALCVKNMSGCNAALGRLAAVSSRYPGTSAAARARNETGACYQASRQAAPAAAATTTATATAGPGVPSNAKASPKKAAPQ